MVISWVNGKFPKLLKYLGIKKLMRLRDSILVKMDFTRNTISHNEIIVNAYDKKMYRDVGRKRWNIYKDKPIESPTELCYIWRRIINSDLRRISHLYEIIKKHKRIIVFYNFNYELEILKIILCSMKVLNWQNGMVINMIETDTMVFLS